MNTEKCREWDMNQDYTGIPLCGRIDISGREAHIVNRKQNA